MVKPFRKGEKKRQGILNYDRMYRADHWYEGVLAEGKDMGGISAGEVGKRNGQAQIASKDV